MIKVILEINTKAFGKQIITYEDDLPLHTAELPHQRIEKVFVEILKALETTSRGKYN